MEHSGAKDVCYIEIKVANFTAFTYLLVVKVYTFVDRTPSSKLEIARRHVTHLDRSKYIPKKNLQMSQN